MPGLTIRLIIEFLLGAFQVFLGLCEFCRREIRCTCFPCNLDRLPRITHFLHRRRCLAGRREKQRQHESAEYEDN